MLNTYAVKKARLSGALRLKAFSLSWLGSFSIEGDANQLLEKMTI